MKLTYIDIHSHLNLSPLHDRREEILGRMREDGIGTITVGTGLQTSQRAVEIAEHNLGLCWATVGVHPCDCDDEDNVPDEWSQICRLATHPSVVAIGETGLDYFHDDTPEMRDAQTEVFKKHIELAVSVNKPLMLHVRSSRGSDDAYYDALQILKETGYAGKANFHFFSGSRQCMQDIVAAGYTVSVDGPITFVAEYDEMIAACPLDKLMIETDAPYAAPKPYRGKTCEPWMVIHVAERIAEIKGLSLETVQLQLLQNSKEFFGIDFE
jgi:TatD DNase family protein